MTTGPGCGRRGGHLPASTSASPGASTTTAACPAENSAAARFAVSSLFHLEAEAGPRTFSCASHPTVMSIQASRGRRRRISSHRFHSARLHPHSFWRTLPPPAQSRQKARCPLYLFHLPPSSHFKCKAPCPLRLANLHRPLLVWKEGTFIPWTILQGPPSPLNEM